MGRLEPSKNYSLFLKATQVDVVMEKLNECLHLHRSHNHELSIYKIVSKIMAIERKKLVIRYLIFFFLLEIK